jgi:hypothetical protein
VSFHGIGFCTSRKISRGTACTVCGAAADKLIVRLYPAFSRALYRLATDPAERSPEDLPCGASPPDPTIVATLADWRQRDVASFPSLRLTDRGEQQCQAIARFSPNRQAVPDS